MPSRTWSTGRIWLDCARLAGARKPKPKHSIAGRARAAKPQANVLAKPAATGSAFRKKSQVMKRLDVDIVGREPNMKGHNTCRRTGKQSNRRLVRPSSSCLGVPVPAGKVRVTITTLSHLRRRQPLGHLLLSSRPEQPVFSSAHAVRAGCAAEG